MDYTTFTSVKDVFTIIKNWGVVLQAFALGIGAVNLFRVHGRRISKQAADWYLSAWLLLTLVLFVAVGLWTGQFEAGTQYQWIYNSLFLPIGATMYSSLAFYMAFGAYKVLRARNLDAFLLFITAIFVILGNTPIFPATVPTFFYIREWIFTAIVGRAYRGIRIGVGISIRAAIHSDFTKNIAATASPLVGADAMGTFNNIVIFVGVITALSHFIFTYEGMHKGTLGYVPKVGRWMMLMAFGASFGNTVMTRFGMYQGRILFLLRDWLQVV